MESLAERVRGVYARQWERGPWVKSLEAMVREKQAKPPAAPWGADRLPVSAKPGWIRFRRASSRLGAEELVRGRA